MDKPDEVRGRETAESVALDVLIEKELLLGRQEMLAM